MAKGGCIPGKALQQNGQLLAQLSLTLVWPKATDAVVRDFLPGVPFLDSPVTARTVGPSAALAEPRETRKGSQLKGGTCTRPPWLVTIRNVVRMLLCE